MRSSLNFLFLNLNFSPSDDDEEELGKAILELRRLRCGIDIDRTVPLQLRQSRYVDFSSPELLLRCLNRSKDFGTEQLHSAVIFYFRIFSRFPHSYDCFRVIGLHTQSSRTISSLRLCTFSCSPDHYQHLVPINYARLVP